MILEIGMTDSPSPIGQQHPAVALVHEDTVLVGNHLMLPDELPRTFLLPCNTLVPDLAIERLAGGDYRVRRRSVRRRVADKDSKFLSHVLWVELVEIGGEEFHE